MQWLQSIGAEIRMLDFDVGLAHPGAIGLEVSFEGLADEHSRWEQFFDQLVRAGLCAPAKRDAMINWRGTLQLGESTDAPWLFQFVKLKISHVKLVYAPETPLIAKAYLWFGDTW